MSEQEKSSSSGVSVNTEGDAVVGGDVVGRDKITNITHNYLVEPPDISATSPGLAFEKLIVSLTEREWVASIFEPPREYNYAIDILRQRSMLWITGPSGIGKRTLALALAMEQPTQQVYSIRRPVVLHQLEKAEISNTTIILLDALRDVRFETDALEDRLRQLERLAQRGNVLIATSPEDEFADAAKENPHLMELISKTSQRLSLDTESYSYGNMVNIFQKTVRYAHDKAGTLTADQEKWTHSLSKTSEKSDSKSVKADRTRSRAVFQHLLKETWLPVDIDRFVGSLHSVNRENDILELLLRDAEIDDRIHSWFVALDDSTRCFILTLALFVGFGTEELWGNHKEIVLTLRNLDPNLSVFPIGVLRQRAVPYVTDTGVVAFTKPRVYKAVINEISRNYREYFVEIFPLLKKWSIPDYLHSMPKEELAQRIAETEDARNAIAHMVGDVGKSGIEDVIPILEAWASHTKGNIAKTVGIALREIVMDPAGAQSALRLLHSWSIDFSTEEATFRRWAVASALWRIASIQSRRDLSEFALQHLLQLAQDPKEYVVSSAAYALWKMAQSAPVEKVIPILNRLVREGGKYTRQQIFRVIDELAQKDMGAVYSAIDDWAVSEKMTVRWMAICTLLMCRQIGMAERCPRLIRLMTDAPWDFVDKLREALELEDKDDRDMAWSVLEILTKAPPQGMRTQLVLALADMPQSQSPLQDLRTIMLESSNPLIAAIPAEIDAEIHNRAVSATIQQLEGLMSAAPVAFANALYEGLKSANNVVWRVLEIFATPSPIGRRTQLVSSLADATNRDQFVMQNLRPYLLTASKPVITSLLSDIAVETNTRRKKMRSVILHAILQAIWTGIRWGALLGVVLFAFVRLIFSWGQPIPEITKGIVFAITHGLLHGLVWGVLFSVTVTLNKYSTSGTTPTLRYWKRTGVILGFLAGLISCAGLGLVPGSANQLLPYISFAVAGGVSVGAIWYLAVRLYYLLV